MRQPTGPLIRTGRTESACVGVSLCPAAAAFSTMSILLSQLYSNSMPLATSFKAFRQLSEGRAERMLLVGNQIIHQCSGLMDGTLNER